MGAQRGKATCQRKLGLWMGTQVGWMSELTVRGNFPPPPWPHFRPAPRTLSPAPGPLVVAHGTTGGGDANQGCGGAPYSPSLPDRLPAPLQSVQAQVFSLVSFSKSIHLPEPHFPDR